MWGTILSIVSNYVIPYSVELANMIKGVPKGIREMEKALKDIQEIIHDADKVAAEAVGGQDNRTLNEIKAKAQLLIEAAFRMEDVIDEYLIHEEQEPHDPRCAGLPCGCSDCFKTMILRLQIGQKMKAIKSQILEINESNYSGFRIEPFMEEAPSNSRPNHDVPWQHHRDAALYMKESDIVGFEEPRYELVRGLVKGREELTVIFVVGMGGRGKTTLAKSAFDNKQVIEHFDCHARITVSQCYTVEGLLSNMLQKFYEEIKRDLPQKISTMNLSSLKEEVRNYLRQKRYVILFDDVWNKHFWDQIREAMIDNKNGSRVLITTRDIDVGVNCKKSSYIEVHRLRTLYIEESLELFYKKTFKFEDGSCQKGFELISYKIAVEQCKNLPLAIVVIGGLLSSKEKNIPEWVKFSENLSSELNENKHLAAIDKILGLSYNDLPYHLKSCFLYFGIYPKSYEIESIRLIRQWIAEGFVKSEKVKNLEQVANQYLKDLIHRSLVQVSSFTNDGNPKSCRVHDVTHNLIIRKFEDLRFCHCVREDDELGDGIGRRLSIAANSNNSMESSVKTSNIRSLHIFRDKDLPESFVKSIPEKYKLLKVLDFENGKLECVPENLGILIHLKYLSLKNTGVSNLPKSIVRLQNLETLDTWGTSIKCMPKEITVLRKLKHLLANAKCWTKLKDSIGNMTSLETLCSVVIKDNQEELLKELEKLRKLRKLSLCILGEAFRITLCFTINEILEELEIVGQEHKIIDLHFISFPSNLQKLRLDGKLYKLPDWLPKLHNLAELILSGSELTDDPLQSLTSVPNLLFLSICNGAYKGKSLHFQDGWFHQLKELELKYLDLDSIIIEEGALQYLKRLEITSISQLKTVPSGICHLKYLEVLNIQFMPTEFEQSIIPNEGQDHRIIEHVSNVSITRQISETETQTTYHHSRK